MSLHVNIGGAYKGMADGWVNIGGVWKKIDKISTNIGGVWKEGYSSYYKGFVMSTNGTTDVFRSVDGLTWTRSSTNLSTYAGSITFGNGVWLCKPSLNSYIHISKDGVNWESTGFTGTLWKDCFASTGMFVVTKPNVAGSAVELYVSTNGVDWTYQGIIGIGNTILGALFLRPNRWLAMKNSIMSNGMTYSTNNGVSWTSYTANSISVSAIAHSPSMYVAVNSSAQRAYYTSTGSSWSNNSLSRGGTNGYHAVAYGNGMFLAIPYATGSPLNVYKSNGSTWTLTTALSYAAYGPAYFFNGYFYCLLDNGIIWITADGVDGTYVDVAPGYSYRMLSLGCSL